MITSDQSGFIEVIQDAISVHSIKKQGLKGDIKKYSLRDYFLNEFKEEEDFKKAQQCFMKSLAGYSVICYLLQIKDRYIHLNLT